MIRKEGTTTRETHRFQIYVASPPAQSYSPERQLEPRLLPAAAQEEESLLVFPLPQVCFPQQLLWPVAMHRIP